jgi:Raf kinase inhibitor-like YbhB/YbcL family protein
LVRRFLPIVAVLIMTSPAPALDLLRVRSSAFEDDHALPEEYLCNPGSQPPPLRWSSAPAGTQSFVVVIDYIGARSSRSFVHWIVYNLPPTAREILPGSAPPTMIEGFNSSGARGYHPICPKDAGLHFYRFKVYALDAPLPVFAAPSDDRIVAAMSGHILAAGEMMAAVAR